MGGGPDRQRNYEFPHAPICIISCIRVLQRSRTNGISLFSSLSLSISIISIISFSVFLYLSLPPLSHYLCQDVPQAERGCISFFSSFFFYLSTSSIDRMMFYAGKGHLLYSVQQFKCSSLLETCSQTHPEIMLYHLSGHPLAHTFQFRKPQHYILNPVFVLWLLHNSGLTSAI